MKAGDWVMQIHSCCPRYLGRIFRVGAVETHSFRCAHCKPPAADRLVVYTPNVAAAPVEWVKRIPPMEELDDVKLDEEITA